jgi:hypothetical protein
MTCGHATQVKPARSFLPETDGKHPLVHACLLYAQKTTRTRSVAVSSTYRQ